MFVRGRTAIAVCCRCCVLGLFQLSGVPQGDKDLEMAPCFVTGSMCLGILVTDRRVLIIRLFYCICIFYCCIKYRITVRKIHGMKKKL